MENSMPDPHNIFLQEGASLSMALSEEPPTNTEAWTDHVGQVWKYYPPGSTNVPMYPPGTATKTATWVVSPAVKPPINPLIQPDGQAKSPTFQFLIPFIALVLLIALGLIYLKGRNGSSKSERSRGF